MTDSSSSDHETLSYSMIEQINRICDAYERELRSGSKPKIEDFLTRVDASGRDQVLHRFVAIDLQFNQSRGAVATSDSVTQFPINGSDLPTLQIASDTSPELPLRPSDQLTGAGTIASASAPIPQLKHFKFLEVAGTGGFGTIWRAMDQRLQREVAVKIPRSDRTNPGGLPELFREAQAAAKLRHPNIVSVYEVGEENGTSFIVTDYINGVNLKEWRKNSETNPIEAARLVAKLAIAIQHAHDHGVIHRDLKLANVLMDKKGEPYIADFGLAKRDAGEDSMAINGQVVGTPAYMSPEQARADHGAIDRRTDVYSLGVMLYELMTGVTPFQGDVPQILKQILDVAPAAPRTIKPNIPKELESICLKCLAKESADRYQTAQALADDLNLFLGGETLRGIPAALPNRAWKWYRRNLRFVLSLGAVAILVAMFSTTVVTLRHQETRPAVPLLPVEFVTDPPGCEITVVAIDPDTGEPDPTKIQNARGRTPLTMELVGGDYLVVTVLDSQRFNEVYRHVPVPGETVPWGYKSLSWRKRPSGAIFFQEPIVIPPPDVSIGMVFCEGSKALVEPGRTMQPTSRGWRIPSFFIDRREVSVQDLKDWEVKGAAMDNAGDGPSALMNYYHGVKQMEAVGKRLPSAAELYYLSRALYPALVPAEGDNVPLGLPGNEVIEGIHSGLYEWTMTKSGGPFSGTTAISKELGVDSMARMIGCGKIEKSDGSAKCGFKVLLERSPLAGVRGVRSIAPRRTPKDFMSIVEIKKSE